MLKPTKSQITILLSAMLVFAGCNATRTTDTTRTGMEQLLISNAIDQSLDRIDFSSVAGRAVFVDEKYLDSVDKKYIIGSLRQRAFRSGARLVDKPDDADIVLELSSGAIGTDRSEGFIGVPAFNLPGPFPVTMPEIKLASQSTQYGTAKISIVAYDPKSKQALSPGGLVRARSNNSNWSVFGIGPISTGSVREEIPTKNILGRTEPLISLNTRHAPGRHQNVASFPDLNGGDPTQTNPSPDRGGFNQNAVPASAPNAAPAAPTPWPIEQNRFPFAEPPK